MTEERQERRYPRWPVSIDCEVEGSSGRASMRMSELSIGGCYVDTRTQFSEGTPVSITAMFPGADVVLTGRVLYTQTGYGFGVGFDPLPDPVRKQLEEFLRQAGNDR